ncbi:hypothetical protein B0I35DRAFT_447344 [Stachybotrys elegans]|uniref:Uncharacterized protein n=1 Tax=Stachybotrys elegans TaxID=80388 RepID=A0A8K0SGA9_9HYPO|nr:hypothetical protein B0I35DRAFT_447344 [Stachybotrys elegans]
MDIPDTTPIRPPTPRPRKPLSEAKDDVLGGITTLTRALRFYQQAAQYEYDPPAYMANIARTATATKDEVSEIRKLLADLHLRISTDFQSTTGDKTSETIEKLLHLQGTITPAIQDVVKNEMADIRTQLTELSLQIHMVRNEWSDLKRDILAPTPTMVETVHRAAKQSRVTPKSMAKLGEHVSEFLLQLLGQDTQGSRMEKRARLKSVLELQDWDECIRVPAPVLPSDDAMTCQEDKPIEE